MKLVTYIHNSKTYVGALSTDGHWVKQLPWVDMNTLIDTATMDEVRTAAEAAPSVSMKEVELCAPIPKPKQDIVCLGMNYLDHAIESARYHKTAFNSERNVTVYFSKRVHSAVSPTGDIPRHAGLVNGLDYEVELGVILGKDAFNIKADDAKEYIFGYTVLNDVSARDLQTKHKQFYFGKGLDGFTPMGPCIVTADEIAYPPALAIQSRINGELRQNSNTNQFMTTIGMCMEELSAGMTLEAGTIIATGTPAGVGMGFEPPKFLEVGDVVECEIESIGILRNVVK